jgi:hypothetical protein
VARLRPRSEPEIRLNGYRVAEFEQATGIPRGVLVEAIRAGRIRAERRGKRWWTIPYEERDRVLASASA